MFLERDLISKIHCGEGLVIRMLVPETEYGTLVMVIPTRDGLVIAADSRGMVRGRFIDGRRKLNVADTATPLVFAMTGSTDFPDHCPYGADPDAWFANPAYAFRTSEAVREYLHAHPEFVLNETTIREATRALMMAVDVGLYSRFPQMRFNRAGQDLCCLIICEAEAGGTFAVAWACLAFDADSCLFMREPIIWRYRPLNEKACLPFGEYEYVKEHVFEGEERKLISEEIVSSWNSRQYIKEVSGSEGAQVVSAIIEAAERMTELPSISSGSGIGRASRA